MRRNQKIVRPDHRSARCERRAHLGIVNGRLVRKVQYLDVPQILLQGSMILLISASEQSVCRASRPFQPSRCPTVIKADKGSRGRPTG